MNINMGGIFVDSREMLEIADIMRDGSYYLCGDEDILDTVFNWLDAGFRTSSEVQAWAVEAECFRPEIAAELRDAGFDAIDFSGLVSVGGQWRAVGYWVANGDWTVEQTIKFIGEDN